MRTSAIRHPKHEHAITVHSWMMKLTGNNLYACNLLAYLENKFNIMLDSKEKNGGWMKLHTIQVKNGMFASDFHDVDEAIACLEALDLLLINRSYPDLRSGEIYVKLDVLRINDWLDVYCKNTNNNRMDLLEYAPFMFLYLLNYKTSEPIPTEAEEPESFELTAPAPKKKTRKTNTSIYQANASTVDNLFLFWKIKTGHKRSNLQEKHGVIVAKRLDEGYSEAQIAHGIVGITFSDHHMQNKYDHLYYVVRDSAMLDRLIGLAVKNGFTEEKVWTEYSELIAKNERGEELVYETKKGFVNPTTGKTLV